MKAAVLLLRILVGATFVLSGWAKAIDVWGFVFKLEDYLEVWHLVLPHEILVASAFALACVEFITGVMIFTGCFRRVSVWCAAAMMAVMLPLTAWVAIADPVSDCGCFGDFIVLGNVATFVKNVVLTLMIAFLLRYNRLLEPLYRPEVQWLAAIVSGAFALTLAGVGYMVQPLLDFRIYAPGTSLKDASEPGRTVFVCERDGQTREFALDCLPDSTWSVVDVYTEGSSSDELVVFDDDGTDITDEVILDSGRQMLLIVTDTDIESLSRIHLADMFGSYMDAHGGSMTALVGTTDPLRLERWREIAMLDYPAYGVEPITLKTLARGNTAVVMLQDGVVCWKRRLDAFPADFFEDSEADRSLLDMPCQEAVKADPDRHLWFLSIYLALMCVIYLFNYLFKPQKSKFQSDESKTSDSPGHSSGNAHAPGSISPEP